MQLTVADEREAWYGELIEVTACDKLVDLRNRYLKKMRICGRSKRWSDADHTEQVRRVCRERRRVSSVGHSNGLRSEISWMKRMVREKKDACWRAFCGDSYLQSPWEVVRWARDLWRERERMGKLKDARGRWLDADVDKVYFVVSEVFGGSGEGRGGDEVGGVDYGGCPLSRYEIQSAVRRALGKTKIGSAPGPDGVVYRLIKAVRDTRLERELIEEIVDSLARGVIPPAWREMRVVFIPKPGRDLTLAKNWRTLNLINFVGKLGEKVVADKIQDFEGDLSHDLQFGSVKG